MEHNDLLFQQNSLSKEELIANCEIAKTTERDWFQMAAALYCNMGVETPLMAVRQIIDYNINMTESIKLYDKRDGMIYGLLLIGEKNIEQATPIISEDPKGANALSKMKQLNGFLFIIDSRLRGCGYDREMIKMAMPFIKTYDIIWAGVGKELKTHNY